jgi:O-antigen/teichoic acid export membrane protein
VGFYSRKVFLEYLGDEVIGLNTTLCNILSFLNLAELGIGIAMATSLYKPIHDDDYTEICNILSVQGWLYKRIAWILCGLSIPVLIALPFIFPNTECGLLYVYFAYIVFFSGSIFSYLWNYRQILIQADQKNYKLMPWIHAIKYGKIFLQIFFLIVLKWGLWSWLTVDLFGNIATVFAINYVIRKEYPWLKTSNKSASTLLDNYKILIIKTKQVFVHKIALFVIEQTSPLIIYAFVSLSMVTFYSNYTMLIGYVATLMNVLFEGMGASIGNLVAENNKQHTLEVFWELFTSRLWISALACFGLYLSISPFISLWIGNKYLLNDNTLILLVISMFIRLTRSVLDSFKNAFQLFADVWAPIAEAAIHLGCSILFGYWWGLNGIILGGILAQIIIVLLWKPYYTFKEGFKSSSIHYYIQYILHLCILAGFAFFIIRLFSYQLNQPINWQNLISIILWIIIVSVLYAFITFSSLYILTKGMRQFTIRIYNIITHRL